MDGVLLNDNRTLTGQPYDELTHRSPTAALWIGWMRRLVGPVTNAILKDAIDNTTSTFFARILVKREVGAC
jgi:hypothetical protein